MQIVYFYNYFFFTGDTKYSDYLANKSSRKIIEIRPRRSPTVRQFTLRERSEPGWVVIKQVRFLVFNDETNSASTRINIMVVATVWNNFQLLHSSYGKTCQPHLRIRLVLTSPHASVCHALHSPNLKYQTLFLFFLINQTKLWSPRPTWNQLFCHVKHTPWSDHIRNQRPSIRRSPSVHACNINTLS